MDGDLAECLPPPLPSVLAGHFDLCLCGDARHHHHNRDGRCLLCAHDKWHSCVKFRLAVGE